MENNFYVYEWYNVDTGEVFYVGKGRGGRYKNITSRNDYFKNYYKKHNCNVRKVNENLEELKAFDLEIELISKYRTIGQAKCNFTNGGEGASFPKGTWNDIFRKLQYLHDVKGAMDNMINEEQYDPKNLKRKSLTELNELYEEYFQYKEGVETTKELGLYNKLTGFELKTQNEEIIMLTDICSQSIAKNNNKFNDFLNLKTESDFLYVDFDNESFLTEMFKDSVYYTELSKTILTMLTFMKSLNNNIKISTFIKIKSYYIKGRYIHIKFNTSDSVKMRRVKVDLYDIVWGILMFKNKALYNIIYEEIFSAPFVKLI